LKYSTGCYNQTQRTDSVEADHQDVWDAFLAKGGKTFNSVYEKGERLMRKRVKADYRTNVTGLPGMVLDSLRDSYAILSYLVPPRLRHNDSPDITTH